MYKHILIATDGSELAAKAVTSGIELAKRLGAKLTAVTATEPWTTMMVAGDPGAAFPTMEYERVAAENADNILAAVSSMAKTAGVACETVHVMNYPADAIIDTAKSQGLRPDRDVVAWAARHRQDSDRQPGRQRADAQHGAGADLPLRACAKPTLIETLRFASPCIECAHSMRRGGRKMRPRLRLAIADRALCSVASLSRWTHQVGVSGGMCGALTPPPGMPSSLARRSCSRIAGRWAS